MTDEDKALIDAMEEAWKAVTETPASLDYMICSRPTAKLLRRFWRSKRKGKSRFVDITETQRVELGIPATSAHRTNEWWGSETCSVDKRCLKRYQRKVAHA